MKSHAIENNSQEKDIEKPELPIWLSLGFIDLAILIGLLCHYAEKAPSCKQEQGSLLPVTSAIIDMKEETRTTEIEIQYDIGGEEPVTTVPNDEIFDTSVKSDGKSHILTPIN